MSSNDIYHLVLSDVKGNDTILLDDEAGILCKTWQIQATMPMQMDIANTERTAGRVTFSDMILTKMSDLSHQRSFHRVQMLLYILRLLGLGVQPLVPLCPYL